MRIRELDKSTAEQIAAGEVIENPASVVKELVENALDAGASKIEVLIEGGGKNLVAVTDNGGGIITDELPLAFKRFATSKIAVIEDLHKLGSLGFRGEALPSIAAVARVKMTTRPRENRAGSEITLAGGEILSKEEVGAPPGTKVEVSDLFYNTPGRKKFLRASTAEATRISNLLAEMALANPEVAFSLKSGRRELFSSSGDGVLLHVIGSIYGNETAEAMIELNHHGGSAGLHVYGFISPPHLTRSSRRWITLVVNGRLIKNALLLNALERGYGDLLPTRRHPLSVLHFSIPKETIDVNVHPAKVEIRLQEPENIKTLLFRAVKSALRSAESLPVWPGPVDPAENFKRPQDRPDGYLWQESRFFEQSGRFEALQKETTHSAWQPVPKKQINGTPGSGEPASHLIGQYLNSYLVVQKEDKLLLIDQHAAHERVIYHRLSETGDDASGDKSSQLTLPLTLELPSAWRGRLPVLLPLLEETGFKLETPGGDHYVVKAVPFMIRKNAGKGELYDLLEKIIAADEDPATSDSREAIRKTIACHRSIKAGQPLNTDEMQELLNEWDKTPHSHYCPHGRPTVLSFERSELEKSFLRRGS